MIACDEPKSVCPNDCTNPSHKGYTIYTAVLEPSERHGGEFVETIRISNMIHNYKLNHYDRSHSVDSLNMTPEWKVNLKVFLGQE